MSDWAVLCDFDGTIVDDDVIDALLERFGRPGWKRLEREWREGRIGSCECMHGQVSLLDMDRAELDEHLAGCRVDPAFPAFVDAAKELGLPVHVVSDGIDYAIHSILSRHGLDDLQVAANHLQRVAPRCWQLTSPFRKAGCRSGTCKCAAMETASGVGGKLLLIGDGASDYCAARHADFVFAKRGLVDYCRDNHIAHMSIENFEDALEWLPALLEDHITCTPQPRLAAVSS